MDTSEDLALFRSLLRQGMGEIDDHVHVLLYDAPTRGTWWERLDQLIIAAETLRRECKKIKDGA